MIAALSGPLIVEPRAWTLVFARDSASWWLSLIALGRHKHVRAYAYVPFLHVWIFFDPAFSGTSIVLASNSEAEWLIGSWAINADLVSVIKPPLRDCDLPPAVLGFCVPQIKRLLGIRSRALRPSALYRHVMAHGGKPLEAVHGQPSAVSATPA